jgi:uncharacterized protein (DUF58 family)
MTGRAYLLATLTFAALLAGMAAVLDSNNGSATLIALAIAMLIYLAVGAYYRPSTPKLSGERSLDRNKILPDIPVEMTVRLQNNGERLEELTIREQLPQGMKKLDGELEQLTSLESGEETSLETTISGLRGDYLFNNLAVRASETFGLFQANGEVSAVGSLLVHPSPMRLKPLLIRPPQTKGFAGPIPSRQGGSGLDFLIVREYQPGDPLRQINWKVSARHEIDLYTTIYEQQRIADIGIILDMRLQCDVRVGDEHLHEISVRAAGAMAEILLADGNRVGLLVYGGSLSFAFPGMGKIQRERILKVLARAQTGFSYALEKLDYLPTRFFPPRSQIILISPLVGDDVAVLDFLRAQGYAIMVISPNPVLFETGTESRTSSEEIARRCAQTERMHMLNALRRAGLQVVDWDVTQPLEPVVRAAVASYRHMGAAIS